MSRRPPVRLLLSGLRHSTASRAGVVTALVLVGLLAVLAGCGTGADGPATGTGAEVLADTSFMADIVRNVAGDRLGVAALLPVGADPHSFEPTPQDAKTVAGSRAVVLTAPRLIPTVEDLVAGSKSGGLVVIDASAGLEGVEQDPHFWLDPVSVMTCVDNIAGGLSGVDPEGAAEYEANALEYKATLGDLDAWIASEVATIPAERRLLVTNHESLGRFAARYGFEFVGAVFPSTAGEGSPSARQVADLIEAIQATGAPAIFVEAGSNLDLARQVASETGIVVVADLYSHSLPEDASTYIDMMHWNVNRIVRALR